MANVNFIPKQKVYSEAEMTRHLIAELCSGRRFVAECEKWREQSVAQRARQIRDCRQDKGAKFKHVGCIPQDDYLLVATDPRYGREAWEDKSFLKDYFKRHPHHKTAEL